LQPGDLVFFGSPVHHVGIYVGGGMMIHAPHTGAVVSYGSIGRGDYAGARRP
jgi:cell wall-associated NlpC family hydrolase